MLRQAEETESSLWYAIRSLEQRRTMFESLAHRYERTGNKLMTTDYSKRPEEIKEHIENLKRIINAGLDLPQDI